MLSFDLEVPHLVVTALKELHATKKPMSAACGVTMFFVRLEKYAIQELKHVSES